MRSETPILPGLTDLSPLGRGGFADVYLARQAHLDRWVAAKVFRITLADRSASDQFQAECQAVGRLDRHPHVITVFEADVLPDGRPYIVTEHCDGSLHRMISSRGALTPEQVVDIGLTVAKALLFAHSAKVLHGDVTPQNILLRATGAPVLADFGLAVLRDYQGNTASGFTMAHAAPETVRADGAIDRHTDVYGLGSTLYTALTGSPPFPARPGEPDIARARRVLTEQPVRPAGAPPWLADLVLAMLAKEPAERPTMTAVADALAAGGAAAPAAVPQPFAPPPGSPSYLAPAAGLQEPGAVSQEFTRQRPGADARVPAPGYPTEDTRLRPRPGAPATGTPRTRRRWPLVSGAAAAVILLGGGLAYWLWPRPSAPVPAPVAGTSRIQLATPVDRGDTIDLSWTADAPLDFGVIIGEQGQAQAQAQLVGRVNRYTVTVQPGRPYCFQIQGSNPAGAVSESNVESVRNAVCRFPNP